MGKVSESERFAKVTKLKPKGQVIAIRGSVPGERAEKGDEVNLIVTARDGKNERKITLKKKLAEGGEGAVFTTSISGFVAKIYKKERITTDRRDKLRIMISKPINCAGICFPVAMIFNDYDEFVGYLMPEARGYELGKSVFMPKLLLQKFPGWTRKDTVQLCITILKKIHYLNERRVILGDINPQNILVVSPTEVYFVDCDSYQIEGFPCPVGTANFTPPEVQGKDYKTFLRTKQMENFAIATLMFMIMLPGKPPYSAVGGETPEKNIRSGNFPYPHSDEDGKNVPRGQWGYIWSHMSFKAREAFFETFHKGEAHFSPANRYSPDKWIEIFKGYQHGAKFMLENDPMAMDIFPTRLKMRECIRSDCNARYVPDPDNFSPFCEKHRKQGGYTRYGSSSSGGKNQSMRSNKGKKTKLCPYCHRNEIPVYFDYCDTCKEGIVEWRKCVNCEKEFGVSRGLKAWESKKGLRRNQCDVCKAARCTATPCRHAEKKTSTVNAYSGSSRSRYASGSTSKIAASSSSNSASSSRYASSGNSKIVSHATPKSANSSTSARKQTSTSRERTGVASKIKRFFGL